MGVVPVHRDLATTAGTEGTLYRTEWTCRGELIGATPWSPSPAEAIRQGIREDRDYLGVLTTAA